MSFIIIAETEHVNWTPIFHLKIAKSVIDIVACASYEVVVDYIIDSFEKSRTLDLILAINHLI